MLILMALSMAAAPAADSPARKVDSGDMASFTATVRIVRGAGVGPGHKPKDAQVRQTTLADAAGQPRPAVVYDFE